MAVASLVRAVEEAIAPRHLLVRRGINRCETYGQTFVPEKTAEPLCPSCQSEQELGEEWLAMLEG
jgi:hypothetical protein